MSKGESVSGWAITQLQPGAAVRLSTALGVPAIKADAEHRMRMLLLKLVGADPHPSQL